MSCFKFQVSCFMNYRSASLFKLVLFHVYSASLHLFVPKFWDSSQVFYIRFAIVQFYTTALSIFLQPETLNFKLETICIAKQIKLSPAIKFWAIGF